MTFHSANGLDAFDNEAEFLEVDEQKVPGVSVASSLTQYDKDLIGEWLITIETLVQEAPQVVQNIIDQAGATEDVNQVTPPYIVGKFIEALQINEGAVIDLIDGSPEIQAVPSKQEWYASTDATYAAYQQATQMERTPRSFDCENWWNNMLSLPPNEYNQGLTECIDYVPGQDDNGGDDNGGGFGDTAVGGVLADLWDATIDNAGVILGAIFGNSGSSNNNNNNNNTNNNNGGGSDDDDTEENKVDWGKIAIWGGVLIAVGLGAYFIFRKK